MNTAVSDLARVVLEALLPATAALPATARTPGVPATPARVRLSIPNSAYRLDLNLDGDLAALAPRVGKRVMGVIRGRALRVWQAQAGGCFIEPVWGHPRIVQGRVLAVDTDANAVLLDLVVPVWITLEPTQGAGTFQTGDMLNFYCESGMTFTPQG